MGNSRLRLFFLLCSLIPLFLWGENSAVAKEKAKQVILLFVDGLSFADAEQFHHYPQLRYWLGKADHAALTIRTQGTRTAANAYLQMGTGGQAVYSERSGTAYQQDEQVAEALTARLMMRQMRGLPTHGTREAELLFPGIYRLLADNANKPFVARIGLLGSQLSAAGIDVAVYGNGDYGDRKKQRHAVLFAMDNNGEVSGGDISERVNIPTADTPAGWKSNYAYLLQRIKQDESGLIVVQLADLARLYQSKGLMEPQHFARQYQQTLTELDQFIGAILRQRSPEQLVILTAPAVNPEAAAGKSLLTPLMLWKEGSKGQVLYSPTTRQPGLVSGLDILPTICSWLDVAVPSELSGHPLVSSGANEGRFVTVSQTQGTGSGEATFHQLQDRVKKIDLIYKNRPTIMYGYVMMQITVWLAAAFIWVWQRRFGYTLLPGLLRTIRLAILALLFFPVLFLLEPLLPWQTTASVVLLVISLVAIGAAYLVERLDLPYLFLLTSGLSAALILLDGFRGAEAMSHSYMGYDPVIGARFYGMGNEYQGVLIGATILFFAALFEASQKAGRSQWLSTAAAIAGFSLVLYFMAAPHLGTNAGGFLAGTVGFGVAMFRLKEWRLGRTGLLVVAAGLLAGFVLLLSLHLLSNQPSTHIGQFAQLVVDGNWVEVKQLISRKLQMNWRLIRISLWSKVFVVSLLVLGLLTLRPTRYLSRLSRQYPYLARGFSGVIAGSLAGLLLNDSGIVAAATAIAYFVAPALYAALAEEKAEQTLA